jgi:hypothetical protein
MLLLFWGAQASLIFTRRREQAGGIPFKQILSVLVGICAVSRASVPLQNVRAAQGVLVRFEALNIKMKKERAVSVRVLRPTAFCPRKKQK